MAVQGFETIQELQQYSISFRRREHLILGVYLSFSLHIPHYADYVFLLYFYKIKTFIVGLDQKKRHIRQKSQPRQQ
jgi:hypothetical protein